MQNSDMESETVSWKDRGNEAFQNKNYHEAALAYSNGLKETPCDISLLSNRALNYLHLESFSEALADAESVLKQDPKHVKALYRKVKALIGSRKYNAAGQFILKEDHKRILNCYAKEGKIGDDLLSQVESFLDQEINGNYNMAEILKEQSFYHEVADFNGPVALEEFKGRGRGLVATEKVKAGKLLVGSKAFAFTVERKTREPVPISKQDTPPEPIVMDRTVAKKSLVENIVQKVTKRPEEAYVMYTLFAGSKLGHLELGDSISTVDLDRITKVVEFNALMTDGRISYEYKELMAGLWLFPAFINHSCYDGNVKWHMHGDFLTIIAIKDVEPGEELRMSYVSVTEPLQFRTTLLHAYGIRCDCGLCTFQRQETSAGALELKNVLDKYDALLSLPGSMVSTDTADLEGIVKQLESIYPEEQWKYCIFLLEPYKVLAKRHFRAENYERSIEILETARGMVVGTELTDEMLTFTTNLISAHLKNKDKKKATEWVQILENDVHICYGHPVDQVLQVIAPDLIKKLKNEKISVK